MSTPTDSHEAARLQALQDYRVLDTSPEQVFDDITLLAAQHFGMPIALVSLVDDHRQWFKSRQGLDAQETPREIAFCRLAIESTDVMVVEDASQDGRFASNPLVTQAPDIRFYAGAPLMTPAGHAIGTLCVIDRQPRTLSQADKSVLKLMSQQVVVQLELRKRNMELANALQELQQEHAQQAQAQQQASSSLALLNDLARQVPGVVYQFLLRPDGSSCFPYASPGMTAIYEVTPEQVVTDSSIVFKRLHPDDYDQVAASIAESAVSLQHWHSEFRVCLPRQGTCWRLGSANPQRLEDGSILWHGFITDITERKQLDAALEERTHQAEAANIAKSGFLANMSHEIRTPMNAILGMLNLLEKTELNDRQRDYADKAHSATSALLSLINDILDFSKIEAHKLALDPHPFLLSQLMQDLAVIASANVGANKGIEVLFDITPDIPPVLVGDTLRIKQVLINLASNAIKFTQQGQIVISIVLQERAATTVTLAFSVQDSGIGIAPEHQATIFQAFSQGEASTTRQYGGTGLGLSISKRLIEIMGDTLRLSSTVGVGSTFSFALKLPIATEMPPDLAHQAQQLQRHLSSAPRRVLVIDDNPVAASICERMVQSWGWPVTIAHSAAQALAIIDQRLRDQRFPFDVIYVDWHLQDMDGWATTRRIRDISQTCTGTPPAIIMVAPNERVNLAQRTQEEQAMLTGFLVKPVTASMMQEAALGAGSSQRVRRAQTAGSSQRRLENMRLLVVEDNMINQQVAEELLLSEGAEVVIAANGQLGVEAVAAAQPQFDAVLMDIQMPVMDGYTATREIRHRLGLRSLPIVAMTANAMASDREACLAAGMNEHIGKPFDLSKLVGVLLNITAQHSAAIAALNGPAATSGVPVTPDIDVVGAMVRLGGMKALYRRALGDFAPTLTTLAQQYREAVNVDLAQAATLMHTIKGTAATLGATSLSTHAAQLEKLCRTEHDPVAVLAQADALSQTITATQTSLWSTVAWLDSELKDSHALPLSQPAKVQALSAVLKELQTLLGAADIAAVDCFTQHLAVLSALPKDQLAPLEEAIHNLDFPLAQDICARLL